MTIREKAEKEGIDPLKVAELADAAGIDNADVDRKLEQTEAMRLGKAVKAYKESAGETSDDKDASGLVLFWSTNKNHLIDQSIIGTEKSVMIKEHALWLDAEEDAVLIKRIRRLLLTDVFEVKEEPFDEESREYFEFSDLLDELLFTGHTGERSKMGVKAVRALFSEEELAKMGGNGFDPRRLRDKALRTRSVVRLINNGIK